LEVDFSNFTAKEQLGECCAMYGGVYIPKVNCIGKKQDMKPTVTNTRKM
jgi:hypothetical protein